MAFPIVHHLNLLLLFVPPLLAVAQSQNNTNITLGTSLIASDDFSSWKSPSGEFAFGFRRLDSQNLFVLAIWFDKIPDKTLVWYANGDNPTPKGSKIELTHDGHFTLTDPQGREIWKPESITNGVVAHAAMLNTGNFILADRNSTSLWESFNNPTDTILPTQVLEIGSKLLSPVRENNYSKGRFRLHLREDGNLVLYPVALPTEFPYGAYYQSHTSDAVELVFNGSGYLNVVQRNGSIVTLTPENMVSARDYYFRATLNFDGVFSQYAHPKAPTNGEWVRSWSHVWSEPENICSDITGDLGSGACGFNSYCSVNLNHRPICECLSGFSLSDPTNNFSDCKQDKIQRCDQPATGGSRPEDLYKMIVSNHTFRSTSPNYQQFKPSNEDECSQSCLYDCFCVVAIFRDDTCYKKRMPISTSTMDSYGYGKALLKIPKFDVSSGEHFPRDSNTWKKDRAVLILVGSLLLGGSVFLNFLFVVAISLLAFCFCSKQRKQKLASTSSILQTNIRSFTYGDLEEATNGFREEIGRGSFGTVYKGVLSSSSSSRCLVAVKQLDKLVQEDTEKEFITEATAIAKTHHKNLVTFLGFCDEGPHKLLVYEFMSNGTVADFLFGISRPDWNKRMEMASGIARGLMYLHEECSTQIIHCDIKPQNILLDDSFTARISDFGLAKLMMGDQSRTLTFIRGTKGYVAPEWFRNKPITSKVDVYSYGVMLLEIICCRKSVEMERENEEEIILTDWVYDCYKSGRLDKLVENDKEARNDMRRLERLVMVAIWCIQEDPSSRPIMKKVTQMLEGVLEVSVPPCPFPFSSVG